LSRQGHLLDHVTLQIHARCNFDQFEAFVAEPEHGALSQIQRGLPTLAGERCAVANLLDRFDKFTMPPFAADHGPAAFPADDSRQYALMRVLSAHSPFSFFALQFLRPAHDVLADRYKFVALVEHFVFRNTAALLLVDPDHLINDGNRIAECNRLQETQLVVARRDGEIAEFLLANHVLDWQRRSSRHITHHQCAMRDARAASRP